MPGPPPAVAILRRAVRTGLDDLPPGALVLVACSGGADSLALALSVAAERARLGLRCGLVTVDHGIQAGSTAVSAGVLATGERLGLDPRIAVRLSIGPAGGQGPEAVARDARYEALERVADEQGCPAVLLGHTRDDQAEQVLLGLARGSGARSLSGMPSARGPFRRPLLSVTREQTREVCRALGLSWWEDPHNADPAYARVRARRLLHVMETELGPGIGAALARTADQLRVDADHLDALACREVAALGRGPWDVTALAGLPAAVRSRVWRRLLIAAGAPAGQVSARHTAACDRLLTDWHGQGPVHVPGPRLVRRGGGRVSIECHPPVE